MLFNKKAIKSKGRDIFFSFLFIHSWFKYMEIIAVTTIAVDNVAVTTIAIFDTNATCI